MTDTISRLHCDKHWTFDEACCDEVETYTFVTEVTVNGKRLKALNGTFRDSVYTNCPACGKEGCYQDAEFATGERLLSGYQPRPGEVVANHWTECKACGHNQAS